MEALKINMKDKAYDVLVLANRAVKSQAAITLSPSHHNHLSVEGSGVHPALPLSNLDGKPQLGQAKV